MISFFRRNNLKFKMIYFKKYTRVYQLLLRSDIRLLFIASASAQPSTALCPLSADVNFVFRDADGKQLEIKLPLKRGKPFIESRVSFHR